MSENSYKMFNKASDILYLIEKGENDILENRTIEQSLFFTILESNLKKINEKIKCI